jgi:hypothetical protein
MREHRTSFRRISNSSSVLFDWIQPQVRLAAFKSFAKIGTDLEASLSLLDRSQAGIVARGTPRLRCPAFPS